MSDSVIYLDYAATTPLDPRVFAAMRPYLQEAFGNPASAHAYGWAAEAAVERARQQIAAAIHAQAGEILFTGSATEANNLAIKGLAEAQGGGHLITLATEHSSVLESLRALERRGFAVTYLPVDAQGRVEIAEVEAAIRADTVLLSLMWVNNETGLIHDIPAIAALCRRRGICLHVDAAQALGKVAIDLRQLPIDLLTLSAHKVYGPKGVGVLYKRRRPGLRLEAQIHGGGQEQGLRGGSLAVAQIVGIGEALRLAESEREQDWQQAVRLRERLLAQLQLPFIRHNHSQHSAPHYVNISVAGLGEEGLLSHIDGLAVSNGSACASAYLTPSHVLLAMGRGEALARNSLRLSFGRFSREEEIDAAGAYLAALLRRLHAQGAC